ncbi:MAG: Ig-like domain-containing protein [Candidatus Edwardsbacteria bacterium]|nr:Ig-like domain-containing protein [Candidatus Edwardsbacteria bacterium]
MKRLIVCLAMLCLAAVSSQSSAATYGVKKQITIGPTGPNVQNLGFSKLSNRMYCASGSYSMLVAVDCAADSSLGTIPGSFMAGPMAYDGTNNRIYMKGMDELSVIDCATNAEDTTVDGFQGGLAVEYNPDNGKIYSYDDFSGLTAIHSSAGYGFLASIPGFGGPMAYCQPTNSIYIAHYSADSVGAFSGATNARVASIPLPGLSSGNKRMGTNTAIGRLYVALSASDRVAIVNTATNGLLASPLVGDNPAGFALCPLNNKMFVACNGSSARSLYTIDQLGAVDSVAVSDSLAAVAYNPADSLVYCADYNRGSIWLVDPRGASPVLVDSVSLGGTWARPVALAVDNGGDVYVAASGLDQVPVVGRMPGRIWRSVTASGQWYSPSSWQYSDNGGLTWGNPDSIYPSAVGDSIITIQAGHAIALDIGGPNVTVDQLVVDGMLVQFGTAFTVADGPGTDLAVNGNFQFSGGTLTLAGGATMAVAAGGMYTHAVNGGTVPVAAWDPYSTLRLTDVQDQAPGGMEQAFGDILWNCADQTATVVLPGGPSFTVRNLVVSSTAGSRLFLTSPAVPDLAVNGDLTVTGSSDVVLGGGGTRSVTVNGDFNVSDPAWLHLTDSASPGLATLNLRGDYWHGVSGIAGGGPDSTTIAFCGSDTQRYTGNGEILSGYVNYRVDPGAMLVINDFSYVGQNSPGWFRLMAGATLGLNDYQGLYLSGDNGAVRVAGARSYSTDANYYFYSFSTGPFPTGPGFPDTVRQLTVASPGDPVVLSKDLAVRDTLSLQSGPLRVGARRLSLLGAVSYAGGDLIADSTSRLAVLGNAPDPVLIPATVSGLDTLVLDRPAGVNLGAPLPILGAYVQRRGTVLSNWLQYRPAARLVYEMAGAASTGGGEFPVSDGPRNVTVNTGGPLMLHDNRTVPGTLTLTQGVVATGSYAITVDSTGTLVRGAGYVEGGLTRYLAITDTGRTFDLGTIGAGYTPATVRTYGNTGNGFIAARVTGTSHPAVTNAPACLRKFWSFASGGLMADSCRITLRYASADFNPPLFEEAAHEGAMAAGRYDNDTVSLWRGPAVAGRAPAGSADGGTITLRHPGLFDLEPDFTMGRDSAALWAPFDSAAPTVLQLTPYTGDTTVPTMAPVTVTFSEPINDTSLHFACSPDPGGWQANWDAGGTVATLTHSLFAAGTQYTVTITGARDTSGTPLVFPQATIFRTVPAQVYTTPWQGRVYRLFSVPAVPTATTATGLLSGSLGAYSNATWRMFWYDPQAAAFVEQPGVHNGQAYWLASAANDTLQIDATPNGAAQTVLRLEPGWNLVGDPYDVPLSVGDQRVADDSGATYPFNDPGSYVNDSLVRQRLWTYRDVSQDLMNNGSWDTVSAFDTAAVIAPWQGYALYAVAGCELRLSGAWKGAGSPAVKLPDPGISWELRIDAVCDRGADRGVTLGVAERSRAGYDRLDAEKPPLITSEIGVAVPHPDWHQGPCSDYHFDYRPPADRLEWPLLVRQSDPGRPGRLVFSASGALPAGQRTYLVDRRLGTAVEIGDGSVVGFSGNREFAVICGDGIGELGLKPLTLALERPSPNPCAGSAAIGYQLPRPGPVSLRVYNVAGQLVRTLADGHRDAGYYSVRWDGRNDQRLAASAGLYIVRLVCNGEARTEKLVRLR